MDRLAIGAIALCAAVAPVRAEEIKDYYCPDCKAPVRYDEETCKQCGAEFEPIRPRVKKGAAQESPFPDEAAAPVAPDTPAAPAAPEIIDPAWPQIRRPAEARFGFGSYGRVGIVLEPDLDGARPLDIVDFRPRIEKGPYQELHFFYKDEVSALPVLVKTTLAFQERLFHYTGDFDAKIGLRELYAEVAPLPELAFWIGSRMYRGDDIYIFDFWPLDDQNTLGGGAAWTFAEGHTLQAHAGFNRIEDDEVFYQFQEIEVPAEDAIGTERKVFLDRNRGVASVTYKAKLPADFKWKVHGEGHYLPSGKRRLESGEDERLPSDHGFLLGTEIEKVFADGANFARIFVKYADGLAAYDELEIPFGFDTDFEVTDANRLLVGLGGAVDTRWFGMHYGFYWQTFEDADGIDDREDTDQYAIAAWPEVYLGDHFRAGIHASWQGLEPEGIFAETGEEEFAQATSVHFLVGVAAGRGPYARPALYALYGSHWLNKAARLELERRFVEAPDSREDVIGLLAEWWF